MPTPRKAGRFGGSAAHHNRMMANLATELIRHGRIRTTHAKAKAVQPIAERMITFGKRGDLHARREAGKVVRDGDVLHHLFAEVGPAFATRDGGYTRVLKLGPRDGDAAPMALLELVEDVAGAGGAASSDDAGRRRWGLRRRGGAAESAAPAATATAAPEAPAAPAPTASAEDAIPEPVEATDDEDAETPEVDPADVESRLADEDADADAEDAEDASTADEDDARG